MNVTATWQPNPAIQQVVKYRVQRAQVGGSYTVLGEVLAVDPLTFTDSNVPTGQFIYVVIAINLAGDSANSAQAVTPGVPSAPSGVVLSYSN